MWSWVTAVGTTRSVELWIVPTLWMSWFVPWSGAGLCEVSPPVSRIGLGRFVSHPRLPGLPFRLSQSSELLGLVVSSTMGSQQRAVKGDLDRVADEPDSDG